MKMTVAQSMLTDRQVSAGVREVAGQGLKSGPSPEEELVSGGLFQPLVKGWEEEKRRLTLSLREEPLQAALRDRSRLRKQLSPDPILSSTRISKHLGRSRVSQVFPSLGSYHGGELSAPPPARSLRWEETRRRGRCPVPRHSLRLAGRSPSNQPRGSRRPAAELCRGDFRERQLVAEESP